MARDVLLRPDEHELHRYRELASHWHGGQWSALYAFSSSGTIVEGLRAEVEECLALALDLPLNDGGSDFGKLSKFADQLPDESEE